MKTTDEFRKEVLERAKARFDEKLSGFPDNVRGEIEKRVLKHLNDESVLNGLSLDDDSEIEVWIDDYIELVEDQIKEEEKQ